MNAAGTDYHRESKITRLVAISQHACPQYLTWGLTIALLLIPAYLMSDLLRYYYLKGDDFVYFAYSKDLRTTLSSLFVPHNAHVVPLFRILTFLLLTVVGKLGTMPLACCLTSYFALMLAMLSVKRLVTRATGKPAWGMASMAVLGISTVIAPSVIWYSASQALWAGVATLAMLLVLQNRESTGRNTGLILAGLLAMAAPAIWSGGYVAGPVGFAYIAMTNRPRCRKLAWIPLVGSILFAVVAISAASPSMDSGNDTYSARLSLPSKVTRGFGHTSQAISEFLVVANCGLDATTSISQGLVITVICLTAWLLSKHRLRPSPLEVAASLMIVLGFSLAYVFRGNWAFESLRSLSWYQAIPQLGLVLLVGTRAGRGTMPASERLKIGQFATILVLALALIILHEPRMRHILHSETPGLTPSESFAFEIEPMRSSRARHLSEERMARQQRFMKRLDQAREIVLKNQIPVNEIPAVFGPILGPGMPTNIQGFDATSLLISPRNPGRGMNPAMIQGLLGALLVVEPVARPPWIPPHVEWLKP